MATYLAGERNPKNLIPFPYLWGSRTLNGITFTVNDDGSIVANGTAQANTTFHLYNKNYSNTVVPSKSTQYFCTCGADGEASDKYYLGTMVEPTTGWISQHRQGVNSFSEGTILAVQIVIEYNVTLDNVVFKPMIIEGTKAELYKGESGPVKILAPSINLFDKSLIHTGGWDFSNCSEWEISADKNTIIAKGNITDGTSEYQYDWGWVRPTHIAIANGAKGISLKKGDIITISADFTLIEQGTKSAGVRCYLNDSRNGNNNIALANEQSISETKKRLTWKFTAIGDGDGYYPCFPINQNKVKIENISVNKVKDYWRIRSGVNMGRNPKNLIPFPYLWGSRTLNGITWTVNTDGTITANGTATANSNFRMVENNQPLLEPNKQYILSGSPIKYETMPVYIFVSSFINGAWSNEKYDRGSGGVVFTTAPANETYRVECGVMKGTTLNNVTFKPMINEGTKALPYYYYD